ncbi:MAG: hypothetical protein IJH34_05690, partial [Romboutsia sp.]|nr:hypothetical protein [Romboutsia sp.]
MFEKIVLVLDKLNIISVAYASSNIENKPLNLVSESSSSFNSGISFTFIILLTIFFLISLIFIYFYISNKSMTQNQNMGEYLKVLERTRLG